MEIENKTALAYGTCFEVAVTVRAMIESRMMAIEYWLYGRNGRMCSLWGNAALLFWCHFHKKFHLYISYMYNKLRNDSFLSSRCTFIQQSFPRHNPSWFFDSQRILAAFFFKFLRKFIWQFLCNIYFGYSFFLDNFFTNYLYCGLFKEICFQMSSAIPFNFYGNYFVSVFDDTFRNSLHSSLGNFFQNSSCNSAVNLLL